MTQHGDLDTIWAGVDGLLERADERALVFHRLEPFAARRLRGSAASPGRLAEVERLGAAFALAATPISPGRGPRSTARSSSSRGPSWPSLYPEPSLRISRDLDLVAPDPRGAQAALLTAGFVEAGDPELYARAPHELPLAWPGLPVEVEVHARPNWPPWLEAPAGRRAPGGRGAVGVRRRGRARAGAGEAPARRRRARLDARAPPAAARPAGRRSPGGRGRPGGGRPPRAGLGARASSGGRRRPWRTRSSSASRRRARSAAGRRISPRRASAPCSSSTPLAGGAGGTPSRRGLAARATFDELREDVTPEPGESWGSKLDRSPPRGPKRVRAPLRARPRRPSNRLLLEAGQLLVGAAARRWADVAPGRARPRRARPCRRVSAGGRSRAPRRLPARAGGGRGRAS